MKKEMFITVGTSLYYSATWENLPPAAGIPGYDEWTKCPRRTKPEERRRWGRGRTESEIVERLTADPREVEKWTAILPETLREGKHAPEDNLRFSAELSSLLMLADSEKVPVRDLLCRYEAIHVAVDPVDQERGSSYVAGTHLVSYLKTIAGTEGCPDIALFPVENLASRVPEDLLGPSGGLRRFLAEVARHIETSHAAQLDFLASGGYKIYAVFLSQLVANHPNARLLYLQEEASQLLEVTCGHICVGGRQFASLFQPALT